MFCKKLIILFVSTFFLFACACEEEKSDKLIQISTIDALLAGAYDGVESFETAEVFGDFGIGTFDRLDGELLGFDGEFFQVDVEGKVHRVTPQMTTPFAVFTFFDEDFSHSFENQSFEQFKINLLEKIPNKNLFYAILMKGDFENMKTRSVPAQNSPYPPLAEVTKNQAIFELGERKGTLVGFYSPEFVSGVNVPGFHFHFLNTEKTVGGHVLDFRLKSGEVQLDEIAEFDVVLPQNKNFEAVDFSTDRSEELERVEQDD